MKDTEVNKLIEFYYTGGGFLPANENAENLTLNLANGEVIQLRDVTQRDIKFHRCYFSLINYIYDYLPKNFKNKIPKDKFHLWLKHLKGQYSVDFTFKDGTKLVTYESISFGRMSEQQFRTYVKEQLPFIYENVIGAFFKGEIYDSIISTIENDYERFFDKLK